MLSKISGNWLAFLPPARLAIAPVGLLGEWQIIAMPNLGQSATALLSFACPFNLPVS
jgi:hypothetical protein